MSLRLRQHKPAGFIRGFFGPPPVPSGGPPKPVAQPETSKPVSNAVEKTQTPAGDARANMLREIRDRKRRLNPTDGNADNDESPSTEVKVRDDYTYGRIVRILKEPVQIDADTLRDYRVKAIEKLRKDTDNKVKNMTRYWKAFYESLPDSEQFGGEYFEANENGDSEAKSKLFLKYYNEKIDTMEKNVGEKVLTEEETKAFRILELRKIENEIHVRTIDPETIPLKYRLLFEKQKNAGEKMTDTEVDIMNKIAVREYKAKKRRMLSAMIKTYENYDEIDPLANEFKDIKDVTSILTNEDGLKTAAKVKSDKEKAIVVDLRIKNYREELVKAQTKWTKDTTNFSKSFPAKAWWEKFGFYYLNIFDRLVESETGEKDKTGEVLVRKFDIDMIKRSDVINDPDFEISDSKPTTNKFTQEILDVQPITGLDINGLPTKSGITIRQLLKNALKRRNQTNDTEHSADAPIMQYSSNSTSTGLVDAGVYSSIQRSVERLQNSVAELERKIDVGGGNASPDTALKKRVEDLELRAASGSVSGASVGTVNGTVNGPVTIDAALQERIVELERAVAIKPLTRAQLILRGSGIVYRETDAVFDQMVPVLEQRLLDEYAKSKVGVDFDKWLEKRR